MLHTVHWYGAIFRCRHISPKSPASMLSKTVSIQIIQKNVFVKWLKCNGSNFVTKIGKIVKKNCIKSFEMHHPKCRYFWWFPKFMTISSHFTQHFWRFCKFLWRKNNNPNLIGDFKRLVLITNNCNFRNHSGFDDLHWYITFAFWIICWFCRI